MTNEKRVRNILLTNDDGIYAPGLVALERALCRLGRVYVVAPSSEQSGVSHSITFLTPLTAKNIFVDERHWGWAVDGSPADCVKLGVAEIMPELPDLIVSGINGGLNAGINVLYSGTVAAAIEGAFYGITSFAVSLEYNENEPFHRAAEIAVRVIEEVLNKTEQNNQQDKINNIPNNITSNQTDIQIDKSCKNNQKAIRQNRTAGELYNLNIPLAALTNPHPEVRLVEMDAAAEWESFEKRTDPMGRPYYWLTGTKKPQKPEETTEPLTDTTALKQGYVTLAPLNFNMTDKIKIKTMKSWETEKWNLSEQNNTKQNQNGPSIRTSSKINN
ncbi:MAG: 5'/3'-nucleotidase SurE [Planctomycetaceae bacterium]|jgi:5'-nucleotidase|nr:5'/3'-nucleotidase SurE [Planctomycetaceae bacterium]